MQNSCASRARARGTKFGRSSLVSEFGQSHERESKGYAGFKILGTSGDRACEGLSLDNNVYELLCQLFTLYYQVLTHAARGHL